MDPAGHQADWPVACELVFGLTHDLLARSVEYWQLIAQLPLLTFAEAARIALMEEAHERWLPRPARALEALVNMMTGGGIS
jgi:hypothetical protein